jgi:hypothetical protein
MHEVDASYYLRTYLASCVHACTYACLKVKYGNTWAPRRGGNGGGSNYTLELRPGEFIVSVDVRYGLYVDGFTMRSSSGRVQVRTCVMNGGCAPTSLRLPSDLLGTYVRMYESMYVCVFPPPLSVCSSSVSSAGMYGFVNDVIPCMSYKARVDVITTEEPTPFVQVLGPTGQVNVAVATPCSSTALRLVSIRGRCACQGVRVGRCQDALAS